MGWDFLRQIIAVLAGQSNRRLAMNQARPGLRLPGIGARVLGMENSRTEWREEDGRRDRKRCACREAGDRRGSRRVRSGKQGRQEEAAQEEASRTAAWTLGSSQGEQVDSIIASASFSAESTLRPHSRLTLITVRAYQQCCSWGNLDHSAASLLPLLLFVLRQAKVRFAGSTAKDSFVDDLHLHPPLSWASEVETTWSIVRSQDRTVPSIS